MKKLYMIGDSIRMGYAPYVRLALKDYATCYWPNENACFSMYTYYQLGEWEAQLRIGEDLDVVHWNVGLHDLIHFTGDDTVTTPETYGIYLERIIHKLEFLYPNAVQIFATNTPIIDKMHSFWLSRKNSEVDLYNQVALEVMARNGVEVNDLHSAITPECFSDKSHFYNPEGRRVTVNAVLDAVCPHLGIDKSGLVMPDFTDDSACRLDPAQVRA